MDFNCHLLNLKVVLLLLIISSLANSYQVQKGTSPGVGAGGTLHYGISNGSVNVVCPVTALSHTILQPTTTPRLGGSFQVEGFDSYESSLYSLVHVEEACWVSPNEVSAASEELCDKVYIINTGNPNTRGNFSVLYHSMDGVFIDTNILYGPEGVTLVDPVPEDGSPLPVDQTTMLQYVLRIRHFMGQSFSNPILCERMKNGQFMQSHSFFLLPNSNTLGCLRSLNGNDGFSMPYVTTVFAGNLSLLFSDPTAIYLAYGSCNSTDRPVSSTINITAESTTLPTTSASIIATSSPSSNSTTAPSHPEATPTTTFPGTILPTADPTAGGVDLVTTDGAGDGGGSAVSGMTSTNILTPTAGPVAEVTQATTLQDSTHSDSTHIATSIDDGPLHLSNWVVVAISILTSAVLVVMVILILVWILWTSARRRRKKSVTLRSEEPAEVKVRDVSPALTLPCPLLDSDSGVVAGSANGGTPVSNCNFIMSGAEEGPPAGPGKTSGSSRESELTDSTVSSVILKTVAGVGKMVHETKTMLEDFRDNVYAGQLSSDQSPGEES